MDSLGTFLANNFGNLLTLYNLAYDAKDQTDDAKINDMMESLGAIETTMDTEYEHIISMHDMMIDKQTRITSMFNYYQEMVNGLNTIMVLTLGITISLFKPYIEQQHFIGWWVVIWVGCFFFEIVAIIEGVFISVRLSYAGAEFINGSYRNKQLGRWVKYYNIEDLNSISRILMSMLICFLISMIFLIVGVHLMFYQDLNEKDPTFITLSGILVGIFFIMRFLYNYGYLLNFRILNVFQIKLNIPTNEYPIHAPLSEMLDLYNSINTRMACLQKLWGEDKNKWMSMLCNKASGEDCNDSSLSTLESNLDYVIAEFLARGEKQKYIVLRYTRRMKAITRKLRLHDWRIETLFKNDPIGNSAYDDDDAHVTPWDFSYVGFWVVSSFGMFILAIVNIAWVIFAIILMFALSIVVGILASLQTLLLVPCRGCKKEGLWNFFKSTNEILLRDQGPWAYVLFFSFYVNFKKNEFLKTLVKKPTIYEDDDEEENELCDGIRQKIGTTGFKYTSLRNRNSLNF